MYGGFARLFSSRWFPSVTQIQDCVLTIKFSASHHVASTSWRLVLRGGGSTACEPRCPAAATKTKPCAFVCGLSLCHDKLPAGETYAEGEDGPVFPDRQQLDRDDLL